MFGSMFASSAIADLSTISSFLDLSHYKLLDLLKLNTRLAVEDKAKMDAAANESILLKLLGAGATNVKLSLHGLKSNAPDTELKTACVLPVNKDDMLFHVELVIKDLTDKTGKTEVTTDLVFDNLTESTTCPEYLQSVIIEALKAKLIPYLLSKKLASLAQEQLIQEMV